MIVNIIVVIFGIILMVFGIRLASSYMKYGAYINLSEWLLGMLSGFILFLLGLFVISTHI